MRSAQRRTRIFSPTVLVLLLCVSHGAQGTSCIGPDSLADRYRSADAIVVGQVSACAGNAVPDSGRCPGEKYQVTVLEVLKDSIPARDHSAVFQGVGEMGCGLIFRIGHQYLLFLDSSGQLMPSQNAYLGGGFPGARGDHESVAILRQFRDGDIDDLSGPWRFQDTGLTCFVSHAFDGARIGFSFNYGEQSERPMIRQEGSGPKGEVIYKFAGPSPQTGRPVFEAATTFTGPEIKANTLSVFVDISDRKRDIDSRVSVSVAGNTWALYTVTSTLQGGMFPSPEIIVRDYQSGAAASDIVQALSMPADIRVSVTPAPRKLTGEGAAVAIATRTHTTRSTQIVSAMPLFDACRRGDTRRGAIVSN